MEGRGGCDTCHTSFIRSSNSGQTGLRNSQLLMEKQKCPNLKVPYWPRELLRIITFSGRVHRGLPLTTDSLVLSHLELSLSPQTNPAEHFPQQTVHSLESSRAGALRGGGG